MHKTVNPLGVPPQSEIVPHAPYRQIGPARSITPPEPEQKEKMLT